ncbi:hypothetical protein ABW19_dt0207711 [Dactylella cylindrospora]|nr:hypothetical protein ABW19_dt0207711 [Dactylella cylindrospora]
MVGQSYRDDLHERRVVGSGVYRRPELKLVTVCSKVSAKGPWQLRDNLQKTQRGLGREPCIYSQLANQYSPVNLEGWLAKVDLSHETSTDSYRGPGPNTAKIRHCELAIGRKPDSIWDLNVPVKKVPANRTSRSGCSSGSSRRTRHTDSSRSQHGSSQSSGLGDGWGGVGGTAGSGGDDDNEEHPNPVSPSANDGKRPCWFWLYDPVTHHQCAHICKEPHHLKHVHLKRHYPDRRLPRALRKRMSYEEIWSYLFPGTPLPTITDRDEILLRMARAYMYSLPERYIGEPATSSEMMNENYMFTEPLSAAWQSEQGENGFYVDTVAPQTEQGGFPLLLDIPPAGHYFFPQDRTIYNSGECAMRPDGEGLDVIGMETDEIELMIDTPVTFSPVDPLIRVVDYNTGEQYSWYDMHKDSPFDFENYCLVHEGLRGSGAGYFIAIRSLDSLRKEYYRNWKIRVNSNGYITLYKLHISSLWQLYPQYTSGGFEFPPFEVDMESIP